MANQPHPSRQAITWRLPRVLLDKVKARAAENGETVLDLVTRALTREIERQSARRSGRPTDLAAVIDVDSAARTSSKSSVGTSDA